MNSNKCWLSISLALFLLIPGGCVERTITVRTDPPNALVTVNEVEQGRSPVTFPFTWYGDYNVLLELPEYEIVQTHRQTWAPIYQWPVLDFISEVLLPIKFHDRHEWDFTLTPRQDVDPQDLIDRAKDFRTQAQTPADR